MSRRFVGFSLLGCLLSSSCATRSYQENSEEAGVKLYEIHGLDAYGPAPADLSDRFLSCPVSDKSATGTFRGKQYTYKTADEINYAADGWIGRATTDWNALNGLIADKMEAVVIDIRRVNGKPAYAYFSNGSQITPYETWSSSKLMAVTAAISKLRQQPSQQDNKPGRVGADGTIGEYNIGDLITALVSYAPIGNVQGSVWASNGQAQFFLFTAGQDYATSLFRNTWLKLPAADSSRFFDAYTQNTFNPKTDIWKSADGKYSVKLPISGSKGGGKMMTALAQAEWLRRLTQFETEPSTRVPGFTAEDTRTLLYGNLKRTNTLGGLLAGESVYMAQSLMGGKVVGCAEGADCSADKTSQAAAHKAGTIAAKAKLDAATNGKWRIYHKLGAGYSENRKINEIVMVSYACLPQIDGGREFVIVTSAHRGTLKDADAATTQTFNKIVAELAPGFVNGTTSTPVNTNPPVSVQPPANNPVAPVAPATTDTNCPPNPPWCASLTYTTNPSSGSAGTKVFTAPNSPDALFITLDAGSIVHRKSIKCGYVEIDTPTTGWIKQDDLVCQK